MQVVGRWILYKLKIGEVLAMDYESVVSNIQPDEARCHRQSGSLDEDAQTNVWNLGCRYSQQGFLFHYDGITVRY